MTSSGLHNKWRPKSLAQILGHSEAKRLLAKYMETGKYPSAILLVGPTSAGKTTLGRAFASDVLGMPAENSPNYEETNFSESRTIDDVRSLISLSRLRPMNGPRRFILCDEAQGILSNAPAGNAFLKPLEEPSPTTTWLLSSMEPEKFSSSKLGKAISGRCVPLRLKPPTDEDLIKYASRIYRGETGKKASLRINHLSAMAESSGSSFRNVANMLELYLGCEDPEEGLKLATSSLLHEDTPDTVLVSEFVSCTLKADFKGAQTALVRIKDGVSLIRNLSWLAWFLVSTVANGGPTKDVWGSPSMWACLKDLQKTYSKDGDKLLDILAEFQQLTTDLKLSAGVFSVNELHAVSSMSWKTAKFIRSMKK